MTRGITWLIIAEIKIQSVTTDRLPAGRMARIKRSTNNQWGSECGEKGIFPLGEWTCPLVIATTKHCIPVPRKLKRKRPYT